MRNFDLDLWLQDKTQKVVDEEGTPVEILAIPIPVQFWPMLPKDVDPATCCTYHARRQGSENAPVLTRGPQRTLYFVDSEPEL